MMQYKIILWGQNKKITTNKYLKIGENLIKYLRFGYNDDIQLVTFLYAKPMLIVSNRKIGYFRLIALTTQDMPKSSQLINYDYNLI